jgi:hypothetical protein
MEKPTPYHPDGIKTCLLWTMGSSGHVGLTSPKKTRKLSPW